MGVGELPVKYGMTIPPSVISGYYAEKANAYSHYDTAKFVKSLKGIDKNNCKGLIVENPKSYPYFELVGEGYENTAIEEIRKAINNGIEQITK